MSDKKLDEKLFGKGAIEDIADERDLAFGSTPPFDWKLGFDIELLLGYRLFCKDEAEFFGPRGRAGWGVDRYREIVAEVEKRGIKPFHIPVKDQGISSSCTGQSLAYYLGVVNMIETGNYTEISARDIYAYTSLGAGQGGYLRDALKLSCSRGIGTEELVPSYDFVKMSYGEVKQPKTEEEYLVKPTVTPQLELIRKTLESKDYRSINELNMDAMAWAILIGFGVYFGVRGENGKGWLTEYPQLPTRNFWKHALFGGKAGLDSDGRPFISPINSWGDKVGVRGWQKLKHDYFDANDVFSPWTVIDKANNWFQTKELINHKAMIVKKEGDPKLYVVSGDTLLPFNTTFEVYQVDFADANIITLSEADFAKFKIAKGSAITNV